VAGELGLRKSARNARDTALALCRDRVCESGARDHEEVMSQRNVEATLLTAAGAIFGTAGLGLMGWDLFGGKPDNLARARVSFQPLHAGARVTVSSSF
jgi:hypothetical protein